MNSFLSKSSDLSCFSLPVQALKMFSRAKDTGTILHLPSDVVVQNIKTEEYFVALTREDIDEGNGAHD